MNENQVLSNVSDVAQGIQHDDPRDHGLAAKTEALNSISNNARKHLPFALFAEFNNNLQQNV